jgi:hypothetical protein
MKKLIFLSFLTLIAGCGKSQTSLTTNSNGIQGSAIQGAQAVLCIPGPNMVGGGISMAINGQSYMLNYSGTSQQANQYITALNYNQIPVQPISVTETGKCYRVNYQGTIGVSACPFNPMAQCNTVAVQVIAAF